MRKVKLLFKNSYLSMVKNSQGTRMFRDFFGKIKNKEENLTKNGRRSCAFFVSLILHHFNLIKFPHLTVRGTIADMKRSGWFKIKKPREGSVILWERKKGRYHLGFYIGNRKAISHDRRKRTPIIHCFTSPNNEKRKIEAFFWTQKIR